MLSLSTKKDGKIYDNVCNTRLSLSKKQGMKMGVSKTEIRASATRMLNGIRSSYYAM